VIPDPAPPFEFDASGALRDRIQRMLQRALAIGIGPEIERAIAEIVDKLIKDPRAWGDPVRNFHHAHLVEYHGRHRGFFAAYSVHDRIPMVFLLQLIPLPGNPLLDENLDGA
jgi:hypothetical protein